LISIQGLVALLIMMGDIGNFECPNPLEAAQRFLMMQVAVMSPFSTRHDVSSSGYTR
jgi:hypothetical protein